MAAIRTQGLTKHYGRVVALEDLTLDVEQGEVFGFLGANGAGKSTTIRLLLDLIRPTRGRASVGGFDCRADSLRARALIGYLPGEMPLYPELAGRDYLEFLGALQTRRPAPSTLGRLLARFGLTDPLLRRPMAELSHGTKRKLGIVQALMGDAPVLVLDEPTSGLDPLMIEAFAETVREQKSAGRTVFLSSHILSEVEKLCDRVALVADGRLVKVARLREIRDALPRRVRIIFSAPAVPVPLPHDGLRVLRQSDREWVVEVRGPLGPLLADLHRLPVADLQVEAPTLEEYVLGLYAGDHA